MTGSSDNQRDLNRPSDKVEGEVLSALAEIAYINHMQPNERKVLIDELRQDKGTRGFLAHLFLGGGK